jgi:hypothetical protein
MVQLQGVSEEDVTLAMCAECDAGLCLTLRNTVNWPIRKTKNWAEIWVSVMTVKSALLWNMMPCSPVERYECVGRISFLHLQGKRVERSVKNWNMCPIICALLYCTEFYVEKLHTDLGNFLENICDFQNYCFYLISINFVRDDVMLQYIYSFMRFGAILLDKLFFIIKGNLTPQRVNQKKY